MDNNTILDLIPENPRAKETNFISKVSRKIGGVIQKLVFNIYYKEKYPFHLACRNTFVFMRKHQIDHMFQKNTYINEGIYSIIFFVVFVTIAISGYFTTLTLADKAEFYLDNDKEINEGFVWGSSHTKADHIKY